MLLARNKAMLYDVAYGNDRQELNRGSALSMTSGLILEACESLALASRLTRFGS